VGARSHFRNLPPPKYPMRSELPALLFAIVFLIASSARAQSAENSRARVATPALEAPAGVIGSCGRAPSGSGHGDADYVMVYKSDQSIVCVDRSFWEIPANASAISGFFPYFDAVIVQDKELFPVAAPNTQFVFEITIPNGRASTGCGFTDLASGATFCNRVTGGAFTGERKDRRSRKRVSGFWGYVLPLHESINVFTGLLSNGWPTDWWADHRSPFPNAMDAEFMQAIADGVAPLSPAAKRGLRDAAKSQLERFTDPANPTGEYDSEVAMFVDFFNQYGGFKAYADTFNFAIHQDGLKWTSVSKVRDFNGDNNYGKNLSEYIIAYLHLGFGASSNLTSIFREAGVGTKDTKIPAYEIDPDHVKAIADAHCSIRAAAAAGLNVKHELSELQKGNFERAMARGGTSASCPSECTFRAAKCAAKF
jgi:hypothetical protein